MHEHTEVLTRRQYFCPIYGHENIVEQKKIEKKCVNKKNNKFVCFIIKSEGY